MHANTKILLVIGALALGAFLLLRADGGTQTTSSVVANEGSNVAIVGGRQIVTITAKGGYQPETSVVQVGIPTIIRFQMDGTFDCSSSVRIPRLGISESLPASGTMDIDVGTLTAGVLQGTCSMGMYRFALDVRG